MSCKSEWMRVLKAKKRETDTEKIKGVHGPDWKE